MKRGPMSRVLDAMLCEQRPVASDWPMVMTLWDLRLECGHTTRRWNQTGADNWLEFTPKRVRCGVCTKEHRT